MADYQSAYTGAQIDEAIGKAQVLPTSTSGTAGQVLKRTSSGSEWSDAESPTTATIEVGTTTTGEAGTSAAVTNSGTSTAAVLNFTIPRGNTGATGAAGAEALVHTTILSVTIVPQAKYEYTSATTSFNRTPEQGDLFLILFSGTDTIAGRTWIATAQVSSVENTTVTFIVGSIAETTGATGAGTTVAAGSGLAAITADDVTTLAIDTSSASAGQVLSYNGTGIEWKTVATVTQSGSTLKIE